MFTTMINLISRAFLFVLLIYNNHSVRISLFPFFNILYIFINKGEKIEYNNKRKNKCLYYQRGKGS